jgi:hypothetical protein
MADPISNIVTGELPPTVSSEQSVNITPNTVKDLSTALVMLAVCLGVIFWLKK